MNLKSFIEKFLATDPDQRIKSQEATDYLLLGFRLLGINTPEKYKRAYITYSVILNLLVSIFLPITFTISLSISEMEMSNFLTSLQAAINVYGCAAKFIAMGFLLGKLRKSEAVMRKLDARCIDEDEKVEIRRIIMNGKRLVIFFLVSYYSYSTSTFVCSVIMGAPPYSLYIPFIHWENSTIEFIIASATEYTLMNLACSQQVVDDSYAVIYVGILRTHVRVLLIRIAKLGADSNKTKEENTKELINCITDHKNIIELYNIIHPVISTTIFIQFTITAVVASTTLINIMAYANLSSSIASVVYIIAVALEILPCCYYANCLMDESDQFSNTIFHSNWMHQEERFRKLLVVFIQRSQKTITLTAGKLFPITLNSFLGIAKFSFSLYTLLNELK